MKELASTGRSCPSRVSWAPEVKAPNTETRKHAYYKVLPTSLRIEEIHFSMCARRRAQDKIMSGCPLGPRVL